MGLRLVRAAGGRVPQRLGPGFSASSPEREYVYFAGKLNAVVEGSEIYYRTTDHLGSTRLVTDSAGDVKQRRDFFPFGENIPADSSHGGRNGVTDGGVATYNASLGVRQQFTGQQRDEETGLDYFWDRCVCAQLARFFSADPNNAGTSANAPQSWNSYSYVLNRPLIARDPDGRDPTFVVNVYDDLQTLDPFDYQDLLSSGLDPYYIWESGFSPLPEVSQTTVFQPRPPSPRARQNVRMALATLRGRTSFSDDCKSGVAAIAKAANKDITPEIILSTSRATSIVDGAGSNTKIVDAFGPNAQAAGQSVARANGGPNATVGDYFNNNPNTVAWSPTGGSTVWISSGNIAGQYGQLQQNGTLEFDASQLEGLAMHEISHTLGPFNNEMQNALRDWTRANAPGSFSSYNKFANDASISKWFTEFCVRGPENK